LPQWVYITVSICQFLYQTLDAVDGKHARNTKSSSPLGQLFDHGCDSFSLTFLLLSIIQTVRLGVSGEALFFFTLMQFTFFGANWAEYHTGVLMTGAASFGVTEGELLILGAIGISGFISPNFYITPFADVLSALRIMDEKSLANWQMWLNFDLKDAIMKPIYFFTTIAFVVYFFMTLRKSKDKLHAALQYAPLVSTLIAMIIWKTMPAFEERGAWIMLICGLINSLGTSRVIVCSLTKMRSPIFQIEYVVNLIAVLIVKFTNPNDLQFATNVLIGLSVYVVISAALWTRGCVNQISSFLGIYCFSLEKRERVKPLKSD